MHANKGGLVGLAAIVAGVLAKSFKLKATFPQHVSGGSIGCGMAGGKISCTKLIITILNQCAGSFGGVSVAPIPAVEVIANGISSVVILTNAARADNFTEFLQHKCKFTVFRLDGADPSFCCVDIGMYGIRHVAIDDGIAGPFENIAGIVDGQGAKDEAFCFDGMFHVWCPFLVGL